MRVWIDESNATFSSATQFAILQGMSRRPRKPQFPLPWNSLSPSAWIGVLSEAGLRTTQARGAVKTVSTATFRQHDDWQSTLARAPKVFRQRVQEFILPPVRLELCERVTAEDRTSRLLYRTADGHLIETVIIPSERGGAAGRTTVCVSSQIGCGRRCVFCETGRLGLIRQLSAAEIVDQFHQAVMLWDAERGQAPKVTNVVFMGMGEPLDNLHEVLRAIEVMTDDLSFGLSAKRITVSTVGVAPKIGEFLRSTRANLAVSLNAPDDERRSALMPVNKRCSMADLRRVLIDKTPAGRDVLFEYILFDRVNDSLDDAELLGAWLQDIPARLNLIPANPGPDPKLRQPEPERVWAFQKLLLDRGVRVMVRHPHGRDVGGACGQLAGAARERLDRLQHTRSPGEL
ncbi:MAG TPA: RNA methyltransferase [Myxococcales bacterium]|nr:RNA methyltransferase [Myxococcales bacterium]